MMFSRHPWTLVFMVIAIGSTFGLANRPPGSAQAAFSIIGTFPDVPFSHTNYDAVEYLVNKGIVSGYHDGTFKPEHAINRAEFTKIVIGVLFTPLDIEGCLATIPTSRMYTRTLIFSDVARHQWFAKYVCQAKVGGMIGGYPDGTFRPGIDINFTEAAKILAHGFSPSAIAPSDSSAWYEPFVLFLELRRAIPPSIKSFDQILTRGEMAEMAYRLHADIPHLHSPPYDKLPSNKPPPPPEGGEG